MYCSFNAVPYYNVGETSETPLSSAKLNLTTIYIQNYYFYLFNVFKNLHQYITYQYKYISFGLLIQPNDGTQISITNLSFAP